MSQTLRVEPMSTKPWTVWPKLRGYFPRHSKSDRAPVIFRWNDLMQRPEFTRSTTLRWTLLVAGIFAVFTVALLGRTCRPSGGWTRSTRI
jgi:hypothetical protein